VNLLKLTTIIQEEAAADVSIARKPQVAGAKGFSTLMALVHVNSYIAAMTPLIMLLRLPKPKNH
jgi:hypothetical protein